MGAAGRRVVARGRLLLIPRRPCQGRGAAWRCIQPRRWSGRPGSNRGPPAPKAGALPGCATPRRMRPSRLSYHNHPRFTSVPRSAAGGRTPRRAPPRATRPKAAGPSSRLVRRAPRRSRRNAGFHHGLPGFDISYCTLLLFVSMSVIAQAIADRQSEIERLQAEIKALSDVERLLGPSAPQARPAPRRSSRPRKTAVAAAPAAAPVAVAESKSEAKPRRKRRQMSPEEKKAVSERMTAYWAARRRKGAK